MAERAGFDFESDDVDDVDIATLAKAKRAPSDEKEAIERAAEESGFHSRQVKKTRRRGKRSVYTQQKNIKMRPGMPELFIEIADEMNIKDYEILELAIEALLQKQKMKEQLEEFKTILNPKD